AERARRRSGFVAASLAFERAAGLTADEHRQVRLLIGAVESAWFAGRLERALMLLERARPMAADRVERAEVDRWQGLIEVNAGVPAVGCELLLRAASDLASADHENALYLLAIACVAASYSGEASTIPSIAAQASAVQPDATPGARFLAEFLQGVAAHFAGDFENAAPSFRAALELADDADAAASAAFRALLLFAGAAALFLGDDKAAERLHRRLVVR